MIKKLIIVIIFISLSFPLYAGTPDSSFGKAGKVVSEILGVKDEGYSVAVQPDGKILVGGVALKNSWFVQAVARFMPDGSPDLSFGDDGFAISLLTDNNVCSDIAIQPDGKVIASGYILQENERDFYMTRFNPDGSPDLSFGDNGNVITDLGTTNDNGRSLVLQPDGKIILAGYAHNGSNWDFVAARYNSDGSLDDSFGYDGGVIIELGDGDDLCLSSAIQEDGKILLAGYSKYEGFNVFALARLNSDGSPDLEFGDNSVVLARVGNLNDEGASVIVKPDGKILLVGTTENTVTYSDIAIACFMPNGDTDMSFGNDGFVSIDIAGESETGKSIALDEDGNIYVSGTTTGTDTQNDFVLMRFLPDGTIDNSFGNDGMIITDFDKREDVTRDMAFQDDGKIILAGYTYDGNIWSYALARYLADLNTGVLNFKHDQGQAYIYPNPVGQSAELEYTILKNETISIKLFDPVGGLIEVFIDDEYKKAGEHKLLMRFEEKLTSGNYILLIENGTASVPVMLQKK